MPFTVCEFAPINLSEQPAAAGTICCLHSVGQLRPVHWGSIRFAGYGGSVHHRKLGFRSGHRLVTWLSHNESMWRQPCSDAVHRLQSIPNRYASDCRRHSALPHPNGAWGLRLGPLGRLTHCRLPLLLCILVATTASPDSCTVETRSEAGRDESAWTPMPFRSAETSPMDSTELPSAVGMSRHLD